MADNNDIDDIPADTTIEMTEALARLFRLEGCDPQCHICLVDLYEAGKKFQLMEYDGTDEMVCDKHTREDLERLHQKEKDKKVTDELERRRVWDEWRKKNPKAGGRFGGGYSRPSQATRAGLRAASR